MAQKLLGVSSGPNAAQRRAQARMEAAQTRQSKLLAEDRREVAAAERGMRRNRAGGRGLLAFVDNNLEEMLG
jgi:uncharacterized protein (UPF0254 family)